MSPMFCLETRSVPGNKKRKAEQRYAGDGVPAEPEAER